jgi:hypothetical protein
MPGAQPAPAASHGKNSNHTSVVTTVTAGFTRHSRTRMVLTVSFVLFPAIGLSCHRRRSDAKHRCQLDASVETSEPHDFTVRAAPFVFQRTRVHRIPHPTSVTIAKRPSCGHGTRGKMLLICPTSQAKIPATHWHDGQITRGGARSTERKSQEPGMNPQIRRGRWTSALVHIADSGRTLRHFRKVPNPDINPTATR